MNVKHNDASVDVNFSPNRAFVGIASVGIVCWWFLDVQSCKFAHFSKIRNLCDFGAFTGTFAMAALHYSGPLPRAMPC